MRQIVVLVGVPSSGKTFITSQVRDLYEVVQNDDYIGKDYLGALMNASAMDGPPVLGECPFSMSQIVDPLKAKGRRVTTVFILEDDVTLARRYLARDKKPIPPQHLSRQKTYRERAIASGSFSGTSSQVLDYLKKLRGRL